MNYRVVKPIIGGLILGSLLFFSPFFLIRIVMFFMVFGLVMWLFKGRRHHWRRYAMVHPDKIRSMSDDDYEKFKSDFGQSHCGRRFNHHQDISTSENT